MTYSELVYRHKMRQRELPHYELRIAYDPSTTLGEGDVRGTYPDFHDAADALIGCTAPYAQLLWVEDGEAEFLDEQEEAHIAQLAASHGIEIEETDG